MRRTAVTRAVAAAGMLALAATACGGSSTGGGTTGTASTSPSGDASSKILFSIDNNAKGPAADVPGATKGGTLTSLDETDVSHLDPARIYVNNNQSVAEMVERQLNTYVEKDGKVTLVGDLATDTGDTSDGGKTWTFHLRDGITFDDGTPITSQEIKYGVARGFNPAFTEGPSYIYSWLAGKKYAADFHKLYKFEKTGAVPGIDTPDAKTIVFHFDQPRPDMPFASALTTTSPVQPAKDTGEAYDLKPEASGPYMISEHTPDKSLTLVKNPAWNADSDPARHQYVDSYKFVFGATPLATNQRLIANAPDDADTFTLTGNVSPEVLQQVETTPALKDRTVTGNTAFVLQENINNTRIKDVDIRKALLLAYPRYQQRQITGGPTVGDFASTVLSPTVPGYEPFDLFNANAKPQGDPEAAMAILKSKGKVGMPIVYGFADTPRGQQISVVVKTGLEKAGFKVILKPISAKNFYDVIGAVNNQLDLYGGGWGADWPSASTVIPPTLDGRTIGDGSPNYEHFNDPAVNAEIDRISVETDLVQAGKDWAALDKKIMAEVPYIPYLYDKANQLYGPGVGGIFLSKVLGEPSLNGMYVKK